MKRIIKNSVTSSKSTNPQSEYEYRKNVYLKRKHEFETLGEDDNNDVLSREEKMNIAKAEMDKVAPETVKSAENATFKNDKRLSTTSERYKGYLIVLDRSGDGYNVYDKHRELEDAGYPSKEAAKNFIDELVANDGVYSAEDVDDIESEFQRIDRSGTDEEVAIAAIMYNLGTTMREAREILPTLSEDKIKDYVDYYYLRDLPTSERLKLWNKRKITSATASEYAQMVDDLDYFYEVYPEEMEPILIRNGATPDKDNWLDGCNIPQAYNEAVAYFESTYDNDDEYSELDTGVGSRLGWSNYIQSGIYEELDSDDYVDDWRELASKSVEDSDGFNTDYTLYTNGETYICMFGDKDLYEPDASYADYETENEEEAYSWFDNYEGFVDEADDDEFDIYASKDIKASMDRYDDYFGQTAAATYGDLISDNLKGKTVSKRKDTANEPGGLIYEANELGIDMWDLLEALEGMCREGRARELDDSTYLISASSQITASEGIDEDVDALWEVIDEEDFEFHGVQDVGYDNDGNIMVIFNHYLSEDIIEPTAEELLIAFRQYGYPVHEWNTNGQNVFILSRGGILGSTDTDVEDEEDLPQAEQEYDSAKTSINSNKLPAIYNMITLPEGSVGIDYGGGKFDNAVEALAEQGVTLHVYDPYNRSQQHNRAAIKALKANGGADFAINSNVLNVIKEPEARLNVLENIKTITKPGAPIYITVYEGSGKGNEGVTKSGYQLNRKTADYLEEIQQVFPNAKRRGKLIVATNSGSVNSSTNIKASSTEGYVYTYCDECGKKNRVKVTFNNFNEPFNDTEYKCKYCGTNNLLTDPHSYDENGNVVEASQSYLDRIEELMNQGLDEETASREAYAEFYPDEYDVDDYDEICSSKQSNSKLNQIRDKITKVVKNVMMFEAGFSEDEVEEYSVVEVDPSGKVEVRAEVDYDGLMSLCDALNPIVQRYDKDSYFEPVQPGIIQAWIENKNDAVESSKSPSSVANKYPEYMKVSRGGQDFSVHYNLIDNSPSADAHQMWLEFQASVSAIKPYDDAEYAWAQIENGHINVIKGGKVIQQYYYFDADDMDVENSEWCDAIIEQAIDYISEINDKVESRMVHNSTSTKGETIEAGYYDVPERPLDPSEYDDPVEEDPIQEICEFSFDVVVILDKDGGWDYENNDYSFAANPDDKQGDWYTYEDHIYLTDQTGMVENLDDLIEPMMPAGPGKYRIQGDATMVFDVDNLHAYYDYYGDGSYDKELLKDDAEVTFNYQESKVENFKFIELN